jgi:hypothetical protein
MKRLIMQFSHQTPNISSLFSQNILRTVFPNSLSVQARLQVKIKKSTVIILPIFNTDAFWIFKVLNGNEHIK